MMTSSNIENPPPAQSNAGSTAEVELFMFKDKIYLTFIAVLFNLCLVPVFFSGVNYIHCFWICLVPALAYSFRGYYTKINELVIIGSVTLVAWFAYGHLPWEIEGHLILDVLFQVLAILLSVAQERLHRDYLLYIQLIALIYPVLDKTVHVVVLGFTAAWFLVLIVDISLTNKPRAPDILMSVFPLLRTRMPGFIVYLTVLIIYKSVMLYNKGIQYTPIPVSEPIEEELKEEESIPEIIEEMPQMPEPLPPPILKKKRVSLGPLPTLIKKAPQLVVQFPVQKKEESEFGGVNFAQIYNKKNGKM